MGGTKGTGGAGKGDIGEIVIDGVVFRRVPGTSTFEAPSTGEAASQFMIASAARRGTLRVVRGLQR